jgi:hypothetical protein
MGPYVNEKPCFKEFTPVSHYSLSDDTSSTLISYMSGKSKPSDPKKRNNRIRKHRGRLKAENSNHDSAMLSHAIDKIKSKDTDGNVTDTEIKESRPTNEGMTAQEAIAANNLRRTIKKAPVLKGLQALSKKEDSDTPQRQVLGEQSTDSNTLSEIAFNSAAPVQDMAIADLTTYSDSKVPVDDFDNRRDEVIFQSTTDISSVISSSVVEPCTGETRQIESIFSSDTATSVPLCEEYFDDIDHELDDFGLNDYYDLHETLEDIICYKSHKRAFKKFHNPKRRLAAMRKASKMSIFTARDGFQRDKEGFCYSTY